MDHPLQVGLDDPPAGDLGLIGEFQHGFEIRLWRHKAVQGAEIRRQIALAGADLLIAQTDADCVAVAPERPGIGETAIQMQLDQVAIRWIAAHAEEAAQAGVAGAILAP